MKDTQVAYKLQVLFKEKIVKYYQNSYKGSFGKVQVEVLDFLYEYQHGRTQDIADALLISKQHASKIILKLIELGLVEGKPDITDKRATIFSLSEKGKEFVNQHIEESNNNFNSMLESLDKDDKEELVEAMKVVVDKLHKI